MKKKVLAILLAGGLILSMLGHAVGFAETEPGKTEDRAGEISVLAGEAAASGIFVDVEEGSFYFDAVNWAVDNGITNGLSETTFGPVQVCNRAQVVTFLWRLAGKPAPTSNENPFVDVKEGDFYHEAVLWAVENGITNGMDAANFGSGQNCNRAQIVTFLWRYAGEPAPTSNENPFADVKEGDFYHGAVLWAVENGITNGLTETTFGPGQNCNRAQVVTFLYRYAGIADGEPDVTEPTEPEPTETTAPTEPVETTEPTEPKPTETAPTEPAPTEPAPTEPAPTEPAPTEPAPTEPEPTEPAPTEPAPTEPAPTEPEPSVPDWGLGGEDI